MYNFLVNVLTGHRAETAANTNGANAAAGQSTDATRASRRREAVRIQRILEERRRAYAAFLTESPLGVALASQLPPAEDIPTPSSPLVTERSAAGSSQAAEDVHVATPASHHQPLTSSFHDALSSLDLEVAVYDVLRPRLSRGTTIVTARALELFWKGILPTADPHSLSRQQEGDGKCNSSHSSSTAHRLPFLFVSLLLQRWQACLEPGASVLVATATSAQMLRTLRNLSCVLVAITAVSEAFPEEVHTCLEEMRPTAVRCVEESLCLLRSLVRAHTNGASCVSGDGAAASADRTPDHLSLPPTTSSSSKATAEGAAVPSMPIATKAVQVQVWRLLSLLLYWMHLAQGAPVPHLNVLAVFLSTSTTELDPAMTAAHDVDPLGSMREEATTSSQEEETQRCTGLSNTALLLQTYILPTTTTATLSAVWLLPPTQKDGATRAVGASFAATLRTSIKVREALLALLLNASKGVISDVVSSGAGDADDSFAAATSTAESVEADHDLGFVAVLTCRLLHYAFVSGAGGFSSLSSVSGGGGGATAVSEQVREAVSPLLGALSILLARFIAEEHGGDGGKISIGGEGDERRESGARCHVDPAAPFLSNHASAASTEEERAHGLRAQRAVSRVRLPRHIRLLGQLSCGIVFLTTLFQQSAQTVLDTMDHSFFFDALVTALQVVGKRFSEPNAVRSGGLRAHHEEEAAAAQAWSAWLLAVERVSHGGVVPCAVGELAPLDSLLSAALRCPVDHHLATLADDPFVDEFLHAYLGLLSASRRLRAAPNPSLTQPPQQQSLSSWPSRPMTTPSRGPHRNDSLCSAATSWTLRLEARSLDTLDHLGQTLVKAFLTADDGADASPDAHAATLGYVDNVPSPLLPRPTNVYGEEVEENYWAAAQSNSVTTSPYPPTSCLYNVLLKHALWCLHMARQHHQRAAMAQTLMLPPAAHTLASPPLAAPSRAQAMPSPLLTTPTHIFTPPLGPLRSITSTPSTCAGNSFFAPPTYASAGDLGGGQDDPFLLFLVHHGLFRVLLHDDHYAAAFMVTTPRHERGEEGDNCSTSNSSSTNTGSGGGPRRAQWRRPYLTLFLLASCLQLRPCSAAPAASMSAPEAVAGDAADVSVNDASSVSCAVSGEATRLTPSEEQLAYVTVEALTVVLRPQACAALTVSPPPQPPTYSEARTKGATAPPSMASRKGTVRPCPGATWRNTLLALLSAGVDATTAMRHHSTAHGAGPFSREQTDAEPSAVFSPASAIVCEALVRCGAAEYLVQTSIASAADLAPHLTRGVSFCWTMCALQGLVWDATARVHMAATCAKPLLLGVLWNPLLRRSGQALLTALLCQPFLNLHSAKAATSTEGTPQELRDAAAGATKTAFHSSSSSGGASAADVTSAAAGVAHTVPRHCRKLCEALWRALSECVNGFLPSSSINVGESCGVTLAAGAAFPSAATASDAEREVVLRALLACMVEAFRTLARDTTHDLGSAEELLPLRTLQRAIFEASREGSIHIYALLVHRLAQAWRSQPSTPLTPCSPASFALPPPDTAGPVSVLFSVNDSVPAAVTRSAHEANAPSSTHTSRDSVILITKALAGLTKANPAQRDALYRTTADEEALIDCIANAWTATVQRAARSTPGHSSASSRSDDAAAEEAEFVRLCSYLVYESGDALDAFHDGTDSPDCSHYHHRHYDTPQQHRPAASAASPCAWSLQNPALLTAVLKRFLRTSLTAAQQSALRQVLRTLTHTVTNCQASLYLAASTSLHDTLGQLLPVVALLPSTSTCNGSRPSRSAPTTSGASASAATPPPPRLDAMLVHLLVTLARCHIDVRQLKQLLMLVIHSRQLRGRRALVPLVVQLLSSAAQPSAALPGLTPRVPHHFLAFHRGGGPAGFRAALPEFPLEGYSVSLYVRWEGEVCGAAAAGGGVDAHEVCLPGLDTALRRSCEAVTHDPSRCCACIFSLRTADRITVMALMVERHTGTLFVQYRNLQQQEVRVTIAAVLPSREWSLVVLTHRPAAFLTAASGGQLQLAVNEREAVTVPQVAYPLMSRGHLFVGCLGHEVDRLSVAHAFYGQVSTVHFFPHVLSEREREILQSAAKGAEGTGWLTMAVPVSSTTPPMRPAAASGLGGSAMASGGGGRWPGANGLMSGGAAGGSSGVVSGIDAGTEQWLAERATLRVDARLSDRGHLYNLSAVLRGRSGRDSRLLTFEGTLVCSTQGVMDSMGLLGALPSVVMPLCTLLVNPALPISFRGLVAVAQSSRDPPTLPPWATAPLSSAACAGGDRHDPAAVDATNAAVLWALELIPALTASDAIRNEMAESGLFVFLGQMLQLLGSSLQVIVPVALLRLLEALAPFPRLFEDALTSLFLSSEVIHAAPRVVQLTWAGVQRAFLQTHPDALSCLRSLGTSMFVAAEVLRVTSEEDAEADGEDGADSGGKDQPPARPPPLPPSPAAAAPPPCSLRDLEHQWMLYFEALTASPVTLTEAQSLQYLVENLRWSCAKPAVHLRILRRARLLVASTTSPFFVQLLGRRNYAVALIPYIKESPCEAVRMEALLQLLCMVFRSKRTQELMNPVLLASRDTVVHVAEEVSVSWLKDILQHFPVNLSVYLALRCGLVGQFDVPELPTTYVPLDETQTLKFAAVLLPLLMLLKRSPDAKLKAFVLTDVAVLLKSDAQAWRRLITVRGWYVSLAGLFASSCVAAVSPTAAAAATVAATLPAMRNSSSSSGPALAANATEARPPSRNSGLLFTTTSMILSHTLFQALLHESYGAAELALVAAYLREQRLHCLLHQVLCNIADRYRSRVLAHRGEHRRFTSNSSGLMASGGRGGSSSIEDLADVAGVSSLFRSGSSSTGGAATATAGSASAASATAFVGLGSATALLNLCYFFRVVETVIFYGAKIPRRESLRTTARTPFSSTSSLPAAGAAPQSSPLERFTTSLSSSGGYTQWEELALLPAANTANTSSVAGVGSGVQAGQRHALDDAYYAVEDDDPHGNLRRAILQSPDGRWLHLPLAVKCAEILCSHTALLHLASNGNVAGLGLGVVGGGGAVGGAASGSGGAAGESLFAAVMGAAGVTGTASSVAGLAGAGGVTHVPPSVFLRGGMLRLFGRLLNAVCRMTLRAPAALEGIISLLGCYINHIDKGQRGGGFLLLKRAVNAEDAHEHSPIAVTMTIIHGIHELLLRRLHAAHYGGSPSYPNANAALVDRMKSLVEMFRYSFEQLPAFANAASSSSSYTSRVASPSAAQTSSPRNSTGGQHASAGGGETFSLLGAITGEEYAAGVPTLQWLCDHQANPRRTVEAFAEVASRADYNAFLERCLIAAEREQLTDKAMASDVVQEQRSVLRRLQGLFCENSVSRRLVQDNIAVVMASLSGHEGGGGGGDGTSNAATDSADTSFTSFFLPSAAKKVTAAARAATWARFATALRGTVWNLEAAGPQQQQQQQHNGVPAVKYVKLSSQEQQALVHRKLVYDRDGTNYTGASMASYSSPTSPASESASAGVVGSLGTEMTLGDDATDGDFSFSGTASTSRASRLRLRGGEAVLLQVPEDEDAAAEEDLLRLSAEEDMRSYTTAAFGEFPNRDTPALDQLRRSPAAAASPLNPAALSVLSVPCEVPYMMHCWSASFTVRGSEVFVLIDDDNKAYNQVVSADAMPYLLRPRTFSFHLSHVTQIAPGRRFRMRRTALEVWTRDRRSYFVNFADATTMNTALRALRAGGTPRYPFATPSFLRGVPGAATAALPSLLRQSSGGGDNRHTIYVLQENPRREPMRLRAMALWRSRLLSNFDYLLVLNLLAGRTLNDMTQYPVFPWILSDYTSSTLDLCNPATFRDLSLPMGACGSEDRRAVVRERYAEMKDIGDVPSHYFTHYSSPAVTLYFLIRLPPYTTLSILLQGGHFDHADRMFHSVQASYKAVTTSTQDVRELIPELFYLPELCLNANRVDFGRRQDRTPMDDLQLPPWAHNDPYTFTYRMREALESAHVSAHLHDWIDLIFGYKQRGKDAIDALNVFNWHSYEELDRNRDAGNVDHQLLIDSLDNIGQTPIQLFRQPHQSRPALEWADPLLLPTHVKVLPLRWGCVRVAKAVVLATDKVIVVTGNGAAASLRMHLNLIRQSAVPVSTAAVSTANTPPATGGAPASPASHLTVPGYRPSRSPDPHSSRTISPERATQPPQTGGVPHRSGHVTPLLAPLGGSGGGAGGPTPLSGISRAALGGPDTGSFDVSEEYERRIAPIPAGVIPNNTAYADGSSTASTVALLCYDNEIFLVLGGLFDNSVVIRALSGAGGGDVRLRAHHGRVSFVVRTGDSRYLVTGAEDTTFAVWSCQLRPDRQQLEVEFLFTIYGHEDMPSAADVSSTLDVVATASLDGVLMLHSLSTGSLDRVIRHPHNAPIHRVLVQTSCYVPNLIFFSHQDGCLHQYSLNGAPLRSFTPPGRVTSWAGTSSQYFLLACQPHPYAHNTSNAAANRGPRSSTEKSEASPYAATAPCILYVHSFFLEVVKTVLVPGEHVVSSLSAHPSYPQVVVAGTENGRLLLLRSVSG